MKFNVKLLDGTFKIIEAVDKHEALRLAREEI